MGRPRGRTTTATSFSLNTEILARLDAYSEKSMVPKTKIVEKAITEYLDKQGRIEFTQDPVSGCPMSYVSDENDLSPNWKPLSLEEIQAKRIQQIEDAHTNGTMSEDQYRLWKVERGELEVSEEEYKRLLEANGRPTELPKWISDSVIPIDQVLVSGKLSEESKETLRTLQEQYPDLTIIAPQTPDSLK